jgi:hypothetical protein
MDTTGKPPPLSFNAQVGIGAVFATVMFMAVSLLGLLRIPMGPFYWVVVFGIAWAVIFLSLRLRMRAVWIGMVGATVVYGIGVLIFIRTFH